MSHPDKCKICGKSYTHGSALYAYYECGHAFEKPLEPKESGRWVYYPSPDQKGAQGETK